MLTLRQRGETFHVDFSLGRAHPVRGPLGTRNKEAASHLISRIDIALSEGPRSKLWAELRPVIPDATFFRFTKYAGVEKKLVLSWKDFRKRFESDRRRLVDLNELASNTFGNYQRTLDEFELFLTEEKPGITMLQNIDESVVEDFKPWRLKRIVTRRSDGKSALELDLVHLHCVFAYAVKKHFIDNNPVPTTKKPWAEGGGAQPYSADELRSLIDHAGDYLFIVLWLRWTGFRRSDAVIVRWDEVHWDRKEIEHVCVKNSRRVTIPISPELLAALEAERHRRNPQPGEPVLVDPATGRPFNKPHLASNERCNSLSKCIKKLGKRAGVPNASPHRFRDTRAVDILLRTDNLVYVAEQLGDTEEVVKRHYLHWVRELREGARLKMQNNAGIEQFETPASQEKGKAA